MPRKSFAGGAIMQEPRFRSKGQHNFCLHKLCHNFAGVESTPSYCFADLQAGASVLPALWCLTILPCACNRGSIDRLWGSARTKIGSFGAVPAAAFLLLTGGAFCSPLSVTSNDIDRHSLAVGGCGQSASLPSFSRLVETDWRMGCGRQNFENKQKHPAVRAVKHSNAGCSHLPNFASLNPFSKLSCT